MKFLVDAQLPQALAAHLRKRGYEALHTTQMPGGNATSDHEICRTAVSDAMVVVTKDSDFVNSHLLKGEPPKLLLVSTGNIANDELHAAIDRHLEEIVAAFRESAFVQLTRTSLVVH